MSNHQTSLLVPEAWNRKEFVTAYVHSVLDIRSTGKFCASLPDEIQFTNQIPSFTIFKFPVLTNIMHEVWAFPISWAEMNLKSTTTLLFTISRLTMLCLDPSPVCIWLQRSGENGCALAVCWGGTWEGPQGALTTEIWEKAKRAVLYWLNNRQKTRWALEELSHAPSY